MASFTHQVYLSIIISVTCWIGVNGSPCSSPNTGWFGYQCRQYECHCPKSECEKDNGCPSSSTCDNDWFGPACQYVDLIQTNSTTTLPWNKYNCFKGQGSKVVSFSFSFTDVFYFTWLRLQLGQSDLSTEYSVDFSNSKKSQTSKCSDMNIVSVDNLVVDIYCDSGVEFNQITITGKGISYLCSMSVSGGRNVALRQNTNQTSIWGTKNIDLFESGNAVDGNRYSFNDGYKCAHNNKTDPSTWTLNFKQLHRVTRYIIFNRLDGEFQRLQKFNLTTLQENGSIAFAYKDPGGKNQTIYYVSSNQPVVGILTVSITGGEYLTLCEVEMYGDIVCEKGKYGLDCNNNCNCDVGGCFVSTGACPSDCAAGYHGFSCQTKCSPTTYDKNCAKDCSTNCTNRICNSTNGVCNSCINGTTGPMCNETCKPLQWGENCSQNCSTNCKECNGINGACLSCIAGKKKEQKCDLDCDPPYFGDNCTGICSSNCTNQKCNPINGTCGSCKPGKRGPYCEQDCSPKFYGANCSYSCNETCKEQLCDPISGDCRSCEKGLMGARCSENCSKTFYGENCARNCSFDCQDQHCDPISGACFKCVPGKSGNKCQNIDGPVPIGVIIGAVVGAVVLVVLIIIAIFLWRRCRHKKDVSVPDLTNHELMAKSTSNGSLASNEKTNNKTKEKQKPPVKAKPKAKPEAKPRKFSTETAPGTAYQNIVTDPSNTTISVKELDNFMTSCTKEFIQNQFSSIPANKSATTTAASSPDNLNKNRYKNIVAYDHSRVHLQTNSAKQQDDYINASYINGFIKQKKFIASQGPTKIILEDFVRMLWEQKTEVVIMLTNLIEEGKLKCEQYWPDDEKINIGEIKIKLTTTQIYADYTIRRLQLHKKGEPEQYFTHFHFTTWPDKNVPSTAWGLVDLEQRIANIKTDKPIVVHCSAGVGRTGTFIALHNILEEADKTGFMDFFKTVEKLRNDREFMVQTSNQYEFLHKATQIALVCKGTTITTNDIDIRIQALEKISPSNKAKMEEEFKSMCAVCDDGDENQVTAEEQTDHMYYNSLMATNKMKNRLHNILPKEFYRPILASTNATSGDYINAVFVPSLKKHDHNFLTQLPLPSTITDFWRLVTQYKVTLIVAFEENLKDVDTTIGSYLPEGDNEQITSSFFNIKKSSCKSDTNWKVHKITINTDADKAVGNIPNIDKDYSVSHISCDKTDLNSGDLLTLVRQVWSLKPVGEGRILYMCRNGATFSGLVCVLSLLLERMDNDQKVSVPLVLGTVKAIRSQVISTLDQYRLLYKTLKDFVSTNNVYNNVNSESAMHT